MSSSGPSFCRVGLGRQTWPPPSGYPFGSLAPPFPSGALQALPSVAPAGPSAAPTEAPRRCPMHLLSPLGCTNCLLQARSDPDVSLDQTSLVSHTNSRGLPTGSVCLQQGDLAAATSCQSSIPLDRTRTPRTPSATDAERNKCLHSQ